MRFWFWLKIIISWPVFLWFWIKLSRKAKKKRKNKELNEEALYRWTKKYSGYLLWLKGYKVEAENLDLWNEKSNVIILNEQKNQPLTLAALMKINKFENNAPLSFLTNKSFLNSLSNWIKNFYSLINYYIWPDKEKEKEDIINESIENVQIPRNFIILFKPSKEDWIKISEIVYGGFAPTLFLKVTINKNKIKIKFEKSISPLEILKINKQFYIQKIQKWNSQI